MNTKTCLNMSIAVILTIFTIYIATHRLIQDNKLEDIQLFEDSECVIGCWQGLQPSLTTTEELEVFLDTTTVLTADTEIMSSYNGDTAYYLQYDNSTVGFFLRDDILIEVYFHEILDSHITLSTIIAELGEPGYVNTYVDQDPAGNFTGGIMLYYPQQGYYFWLHTTVDDISEDEFSLCYSGEAVIHTISIFKPDSIQDVFLSEFSFSPAIPIDEIDYYMKNLLSWEGYGCIIAESIR